MIHEILNTTLVLPHHILHNLYNFNVNLSNLSERITYSWVVSWPSRWVINVLCLHIYNITWLQHRHDCSFSLCYNQNNDSLKIVKMSTLHTPSLREPCSNILQDYCLGKFIADNKCCLKQQISVTAQTASARR